MNEFVRQIVGIGGQIRGRYAHEDEQSRADFGF
jgi:hypothetical protein